MEIPSTAASSAIEPCRCDAHAIKSKRAAKRATAGGIVAALGICAACCLLSFALLSAGVAAVWVSALDVLVPYKWFFIAATAVLLGYGSYAVYRKPKRTCASGTACKARGPITTLQAGLWVGVALAVASVAFEYAEPWMGL